jgi:dTDP-4-dehydrorhamnose 3,5-epimerase
MIFSESKIAGAVVIRPEPVEDERGFFARTYCVDELREHGIDPLVLQSSVSFNRRRGTLRGLHFQVAPHEENKLVWCSRGAIYDVIVDLRRGSPSYRQWISTQLSADGLEMLFVPKGCAHGFITLEDDTFVRYEISATHTPGAARGLRFDDPAFHIEWPFAPMIISPRDLTFPPYAELADVSAQT